MKWVVLDCSDPTDPRLRCKRCGGTRPVHLPISITDLSREAKRFEGEHRECKAEGGGA